MEKSRVKNACENGLATRCQSGPVVCKPQPLDPVYFDQYPTYDEKRMGKLADEMIGAIKDDRMTTKRAISADIAATARVQNQNGLVIASCERELRRRDLSEERRGELFDIMKQAAEATADACTESREYQREQLDHMHNLPWKILLVLGCVFIGGIGGTALLRAAA